MRKKIFDRYNSRDSILIISGYPKKREKYSQGVCAVSSFAKNSLLALQKENPQRKMIVLTMILNGREEIYEEDNMLIVRCFKRNSPLSYLRLIKYFIYFFKVKQSLIEFEFSTFGDTLATLLFTVPVFSLFILRKRITLVIHQVLFDLTKLHGHIGLSPKNPLIFLLSLGIEIFYKLICLPANNIIVLEEEFRQRLGNLIGFEKIEVIPHGVDRQTKFLSRNEARKSLELKDKDFIVLFFGYISWYKGVDFLINAFKNVKTLNGKNIKLIIAGGPSFTQGKKPHYQAYLKKVLKLSKLNSNITITGFVKEKNIPAIFQASDLAVLPYRTFMSSSGPLSLALTFKKSFIISENLKNITASEDFTEALATAGMKKEEIIFDFKGKSIIDLVRQSMDPKRKERLTKLSSFLSETRSFANMAIAYDEVLSENLNKQFAHPALSPVKA